MKLRYKSLGGIIAIGSIVTLPVLAVSCSTNILGTKATPSDWSAKTTTTKIQYNNGTSTTKKYSIKIVELWDGTKSNPEAPGRNAHFSNIIYDFTPNTSSSFWSLGKSANKNFAQFAKSGDTSGFTNKIIGTIPHLYKYSFDVTINKNNSFLTLATRFAPSPDWFGGISGIQLFNNKWANGYANAMLVYSAAVADKRFIKQKNGAGGVIIENKQMNQGPESNKPFGYITIKPI